MSVQAYAWSLKKRTGSPSAKAVLLALANYAGPLGECFPSMKTLAFDTEQSQDSVRRRLQDLEAAGVVAIFPRTRSNGSQTSSEIVVLYSDEARRYAQDQGWAPRYASDVSTPQDVAPPLANCEGGPVANCEELPSTCARAPLALVRPLYEPSVEPSAYQRDPLTPGTGGGGDFFESPWETDWQRFDAAYPWQPTDLKGRAKRVFCDMPPDERRKAADLAGSYGAAAKAANRKICNASTWLRDRGWETLEHHRPILTNPYAGKVFISAGSQQYAAWCKYRGKKLFCLDRTKCDGEQGFGRFEETEWPPSKAATSEQKQVVTA